MIITPKRLVEGIIPAYILYVYSERYQKKWCHAIALESRDHLPLATMVPGWYLE
jgi:hypothetical protein